MGHEDNAAAYDNWFEAWMAIFTAAPSSLAGLAALFEFLSRVDEWGESKMQLITDHWTGRLEGEPGAAEWAALMAEAVKAQVAEIERLRAEIDRIRSEACPNCGRREVLG